METTIIEATNGPNHGKFLVARFDSEADHNSPIEGPGFMRRRWGPEHLLVFDLETGEGAMFRVGGHAGADLDKHQVWVCPLFQPFLEWLYQQPIPTRLSDYSPVVGLPGASFSWAGYRRPGALVTAARAVDEAWIRFIEDDEAPEDEEPPAFDAIALAIGQLREALEHG